MPNPLTSADADPPYASVSASSAFEPAWTTRRLLAWVTQHLEQQGVDSPRLTAETLIAHVLGVERLRLYMDIDRPADDGERDALRALVKRAAAHEPVDYLVGTAPFFALQFEVSPGVLIPRPSTETIVEHVLQRERTQSRNPEKVLRIADVCTGSGCIAISLAAHLSDCEIVATDISDDAIAVARRNAARHEVTERIAFRTGDLLSPLAHADDGAGGETGVRFDYLVSNPPYIPDDEWQDVPRNVRDYEPGLALRGGEDGLRFVRPLLLYAGQQMEPGGQIVIEIAAATAAKAVETATHAGWLDVYVVQDHEGLPRVLIGTAP